MFLPTNSQRIDGALYLEALPVLLRDHGVRCDARLNPGDDLVLAPDQEHPRAGTYPADGGTGFSG